jgi:7-cyano-7-deazaguanine synthase in queuosine biosynthesis
MGEESINRSKKTLTMRLTMQYVLKPRDRVFDTELQFPDIGEDEVVGVSFSGGMESTLIAKLAIDFYGVDRVKLLVFDNIFSRDVPVQIETVVANCERSAMAIGYDPTKLHRMTFDSELHQTDRIASLTNVKDYILEQYPNLAHLYFGFTNVFFDVEPLNSSMYTIEDMRAIIESDREKFERVIDEFHTDYSDFYMSLLQGMNIKSETYEFLSTTEKVMTPFDNLDKGEIVDLYYQLGLEDLLEQTWSCTTYAVLGHEKHCGDCFNCQQRYDGYRHAGKEDPTDYLRDVVKKYWDLRST